MDVQIGPNEGRAPGRAPGNRNRGRDVMDDRKRALVMGKFKFLYQDETEELETMDKFQLAVIQNQLLGPVKYVDKDGKSDDVLAIYGKDRPEGEGFSDPPIDIPGVLDLFVVVWTNPFGDITIDQDIKLFEFKDIQKYSTYNEGPKEKEWCQFHTSSASTELDGFDSSIFWSAGLLRKHFKTCGVEQWDIELNDLVTHYRNWQEWAHNVHNKPTNRGDQFGRFSNNKFSGPSSTSSSYSRPSKRRRESSPIPRSSLVNDPTKPPKYYPKKSVSTPQMSVPPPILPYTPLTSAPPPAPVLSIPPPGQAIMLPMVGPDGTTVQVQLMCQTPSSASTAAAPLTPISPADAPVQPRYNYINPNFSAPPPTQSNNQWSSAVEDFLQRPSTAADSSTSKNNSGRKRELVPCNSSSPKLKSSSKDIERSKMLEDLKALQKKRKLEQAKVKEATKKFRPKSQIEAPTFTGGVDVNILDISPEDKVYMGTIKDWKGKFGFLKCEDIPGKIFLHSKDIQEGRDMVGVQRLVTFQVLHIEKSAVGAKAVNAMILK